MRSRDYYTSVVHSFFTLYKCIHLKAVETYSEASHLRSAVSDGLCGGCLMMIKLIVLSKGSVTCYLCTSWALQVLFHS